jgi:hypothetical protein
MKKFFTLAIALMGFAGAANAATVDDIALLKHSYVLVCDEAVQTRAKETLIGDNHFLDLKGGSTATNKGQVDLSQVDALGEDGAPLYVTQDIVDKYGEYGKHYNWLRLKNQQDMLAMKLTAGTKIIIFLQGNNKVGKDARIPRISTDAAQTNSLNEAPGTDHPATVSGFRWEYTVSDDGTYYLGSYNGDMFVSFIIIEANEAPGTPTVKVGDQTYEGGLWFREVTCKANDVVSEESSIPTIVTYTTDGSTPTAESPVYSSPIKCYKDMTVKFQAYMDFGIGAMEDFIAPNADNEANVNFSFNAPKIEVDGANVKVVSEYEGAKNFYSLNGEDAQEGSEFTLTESAVVSAYSQIVNGSYTTFTTKSTTQDVYVLNALKGSKVLTATGDAVLDEEATATSTTGPVYKVENGEIDHDNMDFFVKNPEFGAVMDEAYQIDGQEVYIKMNNTNISFKVAANDVVKVKVTCSKNACKTLNPDNDESITTDRKCYVNVSGTNYGNDDITAENGNIIEFELKGGEEKTVNDGEGVITQFVPEDKIYTFQKYSGTGNILIAKIEFEVGGGESIKGDVNGDGQVGIGDIISITNYMSGEPNGVTLEQADVNGDGEVGIGDIITVTNIMAGGE